MRQTKVSSLTIFMLFRPTIGCLERASSACFRRLEGGNDGMIALKPEPAPKRAMRRRLRARNAGNRREDAMKDYQIHLMDELRAGRMSRRELLRCASVAGISLAAFGPSIGARPARADTPKRGGTIRLAAQIPGKDPEPVTASNAGEVFTYQPSLEYLCYPREDWTLDPRLATSWKADPSPKTWVLTLRQRDKSHDSSLLTADDV